MNSKFFDVSAEISTTKVSVEIANKQYLVPHALPPIYRWPLALRVPAAQDSVANAKAVQVPSIFLVDELDTAVPPKYQQLVIQAYAGKKQVISVPAGYHIAPLTGSALAQVQKWAISLFPAW